jgi:hypothetical protein
MRRPRRGTHRWPNRAGTRARARHLCTGTALAVIAAACYRQPPMGDPLPGATEVTYADSEAAVFAAATQALVDEGLSIQTVDDAHRWVTSVPVDIGMLSHLPMAASNYSGDDRVVMFRFVTRKTFGATTLYGEVLYQPNPLGGQRSVRPVPKDNPARAVLTRMITRVQRELEDGRDAAARP